MIEAPEALILAMQLNETVRGKTINYVIAAQTPHKFTWYHDSPESYPDKLTGKIVENCTAFGGMVEINISSDTTLLFCDGANLRYYSPGENLPGQAPASHRIFRRKLLGRIRPYVWRIVLFYRKQIRR